MTRWFSSPRRHAGRTPPAPPVLRAAAILCAAVAVAVVAPLPIAAQGGGGVPSIESRTEGMTRIDGFFPLYYEADQDRLWMEVNQLDTEVLHSTGLAAGLGSNDVGLDRGQLSGSRVVKFERAGPRLLMVQPNLRFRTNTDNPAEARAVEDAFARSVIQSCDVEAATGERVLIDLSSLIFSDFTGIAGRLGNYRLERDRSSVYMPMTQGFPLNTEIEVELTFVQGGGAGGGGGGRGGGGFFEGVGSVAATGSAASLRVHQSFVQLPGPGFEARPYDARSGFGSTSWQDYSAPLGSPMTQRVTRRHRLEKVNPSAAMGPAVEPIIYYLDAGVPEPMRTALLEGARWWNQAFEAAGYENAFQVELLPEGASQLDVRYNTINWVHRSTRGWSTGGSVTDPRTGEIIKGTVTLGSLRIRQDYMIAEGLLSPYANGDETPPELAEWALARLAQLSAHEVGHTIGLGHNYYDSEAGRISVMDYPHPLVTLEPNGEFDYSEVYEVGIGEWDSVAINYGYRDFADGVDENVALKRILDDAWDEDIRYMSNQDISVHPRVDQWSNGTDAAMELGRMMDVRTAAMARFGERAIHTGEAMAQMEQVFVPLYLHHRYQIEATGTVIGGVDYIYSYRGDGRDPFSYVSGQDQRQALNALLNVLDPSELALPRSLIEQLPPRPGGFSSGREFFPRWTGSMFDVVTPAVVLADHTISSIIDNSKAARLVQQSALDPSIPGLDDVLSELFGSVFGADTDDAYEEEIRRAVEWIAVARVMGVASGAAMPQARAVALQALETRGEALESMVGSAGAADAAHYSMLAGNIERFLEDPSSGPTLSGAPSAPPGAPIGSMPQDYLAGSQWINGGGAPFGDSMWSQAFDVLCYWQPGS